MKTISVPVDFSILLDAADGVSLYIDEDENPALTLSLPSLVNDWIDCVSVEDKIHSYHTEDAYALIKELRHCIELLTQAIDE
jgi:hypothetical protein